MSDRYRLLLAEAARFYEKHEAGRQDPFNIFSVLRSSSDEVNLHSRFLHALLDHKKPGKETRENLTDFLQHVGVKDFEPTNANVERERDNIDILITNGVGQAVGVENKIWAGDQSKQLKRYHQELTKQGYRKIRLLYLTLEGHPPSEDSAGGLDCKTISCISYKDDLRPWLRRCQKRAYDEPALRESVAQYVQLVQKLTGTDFKEAYMKDLTELCLQDNNLVLVHDLNEAMIEARVCLLRKLWCEIDSALKEQLPVLPPKDEDGKNEAPSDTDERIRLYLKPMSRGHYHGLHYSFGRGVASLFVEAGEGNGLFFGVRCHKDHKDERSNLDRALKDVKGRPTDWCPRYRKDDLNLKNPSREELERLSSEAGRKKHAKRIAQGLKPFWEAVKAAGLTRDFSDQAVMTATKGLLRST